MNNKKRITYFLIFVISLLVEIMIGLYMKDDFIRPYIGDVLVIVVLTSFLRLFWLDKPKYLGIYVTFFAVVVEFIQLFHLDRLLHIQGTLLGVITGSTFDWKDILCYLIGAVIFIACERMLQNNK